MERKDAWGADLENQLDELSDQKHLNLDHIKEGILENVEARNSKIENVQDKINRQKTHISRIQQNIDKNQQLLNRWIQQNQRDLNKLDNEETQKDI